jgi:hypothetical protein
MRTLLLLLLLTSSAYSFTPPSCGDPWYYQSDDRGITFQVPDKAQHYYGSYILNDINTHYLGEWGPAVTFALGFLWEVKDSQTPWNDGVVGFSYKDLLADALGILSSQLNREHSNIRMYLTYDKHREQITLHTSWLF